LLLPEATLESSPALSNAHPWWQNARLWSQKRRWYEQNSLPWNRACIHREFARRRAFVRWPVHGNVLRA
jgi:hypothetical protein